MLGLNDHTIGRAGATRETRTRFVLYCFRLQSDARTNDRQHVRVHFQRCVTWPMETPCSRRSTAAKNGACPE
jgi:hypothetical protein